jgi:tryptophanyl-tRNA synthetase
MMITGVRPTGFLTIGNYLGAIKPLLESAEDGTAVFVADLHGLTDADPSTVAKYRLEVVRDYLALGVDSSRFYLYLQSAIGRETALCASYLSPLMSVAELLRVPTLKDKVKGGGPESANVALLNYPILMAADIFLQQASLVPVGEDQLAHLEVARVLATRFNRLYGHDGSRVLIEPKPLALKSLRILSLNGEGKMSKSNPVGAIFLTDSSAVVSKKIKSAVTALPGEMNPNLESLFLIGTLLSENDETRTKFEEFMTNHLAGEKVMGYFKNLLIEVVNRFLDLFQRERKLYSNEDILEILEEGRDKAREKARSVLSDMERAMGF